MLARAQRVAPIGESKYPSEHEDYDPESSSDEDEHPPEHIESRIRMLSHEERVTHYPTTTLDVVLADHPDHPLKLRRLPPLTFMAVVKREARPAPRFVEAHADATTGGIAYTSKTWEIRHLPATFLRLGLRLASDMILHPAIFDVVVERLLDHIPDTSHFNVRHATRYTLLSKEWLIALDRQGELREDARHQLQGPRDDDLDVLASTLFVEPKIHHLLTKLDRRQQRPTREEYIMVSLYIATSFASQILALLPYWITAVYAHTGLQPVYIQDLEVRLWQYMLERMWFSGPLGLLRNIPDAPSPGAAAEEPKLINLVVFNQAAHPVAVDLVQSKWIESAYSALASGKYDMVSLPAASELAAFSAQEYSVSWLRS